MEKSKHSYLIIQKQYKRRISQEIISAKGAIAILSFLYADLYLIGDGTSISSFMRTKQLFVLIHVRNKGEVDAINHLRPPIFFLLTVTALFCYLCFVSAMLFLSVPCTLVVTCWERSDLLALLCPMFSCVFVNFPYGVLCQVWYLIVSIPPRCLLLYFN